MIATINIEKLLSEMKCTCSYLAGYFTDGNGYILDDITHDDIIIESAKIRDLKGYYETLVMFVKSGTISLAEVAAELDKAILLITILNEFQQNEKRKPKRLPNDQNCNDLATINAAKI